MGLGSLNVAPLNRIPLNGWLASGIDLPRSADVFFVLPECTVLTAPADPQLQACAEGRTFVVAAETRHFSVPRRR